MPSVETRKKIVDLLFETFPSKYKIMLIGAQDGLLEYAVNKGAGVRTDGMGEKWHETEGFPAYFSNIPDVWKQAPIAGEAHGAIQNWDDPSWHGGRAYGLTPTINNALARHYSYFNWQDGKITSPQMLEEVKRFERGLGYRLVLKRFECPRFAKPGEHLTIQTQWQNVGCAPPYFDYYLAFRISNGSGSKDYITTTSIKGWLPGMQNVEEKFTLPHDLIPGKYNISVGLIDPQTEKASIPSPLSKAERNRYNSSTNFTIYAITIISSKFFIAINWISFE
jgi:hypothetical protein